MSRTIGGMEHWEWVRRIRLRLIGRSDVVEAEDLARVSERDSLREAERALYMVEVSAQALREHLAAGRVPCAVDRAKRLREYAETVERGLAGPSAALPNDA